MIPALRNRTTSGPTATATCGAVLARDLGAEMLLILTDVDGVYADWGTPKQRPLSRRNGQAIITSRSAGQRAVHGKAGTIITGRTG